MRAFLTGALLVFLGSAFPRGNSDDPIPSIRQPPTSDSIVITVNIDRHSVGDSIYFEFYPQLFGDNTVAPLNTGVQQRSWKVPVAPDGKCKLVIGSVLEPGYLVFSKDWLVPGGHYLPFLMPSVVSPGANIAIDIHPDSDYSRFDYSQKQAWARNYRLHFSGPGSDGFQAEYYKLHPYETGDTAFFAKYIPILSGGGCVNPDNYHFRLTRKILKATEESSMAVGSAEQQLVAADMWGYYLYYVAIDYLGKPSKIVSNSCLHFRDRYLRNMIDSLNSTLGCDAASKSKCYATGVYFAERSIWLDSLGEKGIVNFYTRLKAYPPGLLRDKLLTDFVTSENNGSLENLDSLVNDCYANISDTTLRESARTIKNRIKGGKAYPLNLPDTNGRIVTLDEFKGKIVLIDFFYKGCLHCADYYQHVLKFVEADYSSDTNVVFISISIDKVRSTWLEGLYSGKYASVSGINTVNLYTGGSGEDHPIIKYYHVTGYPEPILIDGAGNVAEAGFTLRILADLEATLNKLLAKKT